MGWAAGVSFEDRQDLLGHRSGRITTHYLAAELGNLLSAANRVVGEGSRKTPAVTRRLFNNLEVRIRPNAYSRFRMECKPTWFGVTLSSLRNFSVRRERFNPFDAKILKQSYKAGQITVAGIDGG